MKSFSMSYDNHLVKVIDKDTRVVMKWYADGEFRQSFIVPCDYRPLPSNNYEVFTCENTETISDQHILNLLNKVKFSVGRCYSSSQEIYDLLSASGYKPIVYECWCVIVGAGRATHHCVVKIGNSVIDTGASDSVQGEFKRIAKEKGLTDISESRNLLADIVESCKNKSIVEVNPTIGKLAKDLIIVGSPSDPEKARINYNALMDKYPDHTDYTGYGLSRYGNTLNRILLQRGFEE